MPKRPTAKYSKTIAKEMMERTVRPNISGSNWEHIKKQLDDDANLHHYSDILAKYKPALRQKSFYRLLRVFVQLMYDYSSSSGIYKRVLHRERAPELELFDFFQKVRPADVKDILHSARNTARSYAYFVKIITSLLYSYPKEKK